MNKLEALLDGRTKMYEESMLCHFYEMPDGLPLALYMNLIRSDLVVKIDKYIINLFMCFTFCLH